MNLFFLLGLMLLLVRLNQFIWVLISLEILNLALLWFLTQLMSLNWVLFLLSLQVVESVLLLILMILYYRMI